jgi:hypothetical protein
LVRIQPQDSRDAVADGIQVVGQLRSLGVDDAIEVDNAVTGFVCSCGCGTQHIGRVAAAVGGIGVGKQSADVGQGGCTQQGIGHRVQQDVGITVAHELTVVRHIDATESQRPTRRRAVRVFPNSDPQGARVVISGARGNLVNLRGLYPAANNATTRDGSELNRKRWTWRANLTHHPWQIARR